MEITILTWEFPPRIVGQLAAQVKKLSVQLSKHHVKTHVVTYYDYLAEPYEESEGIKIYRVTNPVRTHIGVLTWVLTLNQEVERISANIYYKTQSLNLIDTHDWHFIPAAVTLKKGLNIPFNYSVDSLEEHRSHRANRPFNQSIRSIEWLGLYEAEKIIVKSKWMKNETTRLFKVPKKKIVVAQPESPSWIETVLATYDDVGGTSPR
jgi:1,4-alpha-glucan branching enzyme